MSLLALPEREPGSHPALIAGANPAAKLLISLAVSSALLLTVDPVTAGTALALVLAALPWCGLGGRQLARCAVLIGIGAVPIGLSTVLFGIDSGSVLLVVGPVSVTEGSLSSGLAIALRVFAIALPGVVLLASTDPTDLADALAQVLRLPATFVLSALAAMRLLGVFVQEWQALTLARRARGLGDGGPFGRLRTVIGQTFALLVIAIRRATVLATAMEARGFGTGGPRTWARPSRFTRTDWLLVLGGVLLAVVATAAGLAAGTWHVSLGG